MTRSTPHRGWMLWGVLLVCFLLVPALIAGCSDNKGSKGPSYGSSITGTATNGLFILSVNLNPNMVQPGQSAGITVLATTINGAPLEGRSVQLSTTGGTLSTVAGKTDAAGKFVATITIDVKDTSASQTITAIVDGVSVTGTLYIGVPGTLTILPASVTMAPGATQVFQASGGVEPYRWEAIGGTLNRYNEPTVIFTAGSAVGTFYLTVRDAAGNSASVPITISLTAGGLTITPSGDLALNPGQQQIFRASGGRPPYTWTATGGTPTSGSGDTFTYTAGNIPGVFTVSLRDSTGQTLSAKVTIPLTTLTFGPNLEISATASGAAPGSCSVGSVSAKITAAGGVPPYSFVAALGTVTAISPPAANSSPTTITYASPVVSGIGGGTTVLIDTVTVVDATGTRKDATVTVKCAAVP